MCNKAYSSAPSWETGLAHGRQELYVDYRACESQGVGFKIQSS